jgi:methionine synthase II (cobalamin-independent)
MANFELHRNPPFRAEHLGSLKRPDHLIEQRNALDAGKISDQELTATEDEAIKWIIEKQQEWGFRALSDGEYRSVYTLGSRIVNESNH